MSNVTSGPAAVVCRNWSFTPWAFPRLCCLSWAVALVQAMGPFWFEDGPSVKGIYDSRRGESPCPRCDGYRHSSGFCGQCGRNT